jgi:hypothetical protein
VRDDGLAVEVPDSSLSMAKPSSAARAAGPRRGVSA